MAKFDNLEDANVEIVNLENKIAQLNELVDHYKESEKKFNEQKSSFETEIQRLKNKNYELFERVTFEKQEEVQEKEIDEEVQKEKALDDLLKNF